MRTPLIITAALASAFLALAAPALASGPSATTTRVTWGQTGWSCAVVATAPSQAGVGYGYRHADGFATCTNGSGTGWVSNITITTCLQIRYGSVWSDLRCSSARNGSGEASVDAAVTRSCGSGYHALRTRVTATSLQPVSTLIAKHAMSTSKPVGCSS